MTEEMGDHLFFLFRYRNVIPLAVGLGVFQVGEFSFVLVELDQMRIKRAKAAGFPIVYGDGSQEVVQDALRIQRASLLVVTIPGIVVARSIISNARKVNSGIRVIAQMSNPDFFSVFKELQVTDLVNSELEAALEISLLSR